MRENIRGAGRARCALSALALVLTAWACGHSAQYYLDRGNGFAANGKYEEAALNYRKVLAADANNGEACYQLSSALLRMGKAQEAYQQLARAAEILPDRADIAVKYADLTLAAYLADRRRPKILYDRVAGLSASMLARDSKSYDGLRLKGSLAAADKRLKEAEDLFRAANEVKPLQPGVVTGWVEVLFADAQPSEAESLAYRLIAREKAYSPIYDLLYAYYVRAKLPQEAEKVLRLRAENNPSDAGSYLRLAAFYAAARRESDMQAALAHLTQNPGAFPRGPLQAGGFYAQLRRWDEAMAQYQAGMKAHPGDRVDYLRQIATVWLSQGKSEPAEKTVDEILAAKPEDESAQTLKARLLFATRKPDRVAKALTMLQALVAKNPNDATLHFYLGEALVAKGDADAARLQFLDAIHRRSDSVPPRVALAEMAQERGEFKIAFQYANEILAIDPSLPRVRLLRAICMTHLDRNADARVEFRKLSQAFPGNRETRLETALLDLRERKLGDAEKAFRELAAEVPGDPKPVAGVAEALLAGNQPDKAIGFLQEQLQKRPDDTRLHSMLAEIAVRTGKYDLAAEQYRLALPGADAPEQICLSLGSVYMLKKDAPSSISWLEKARAMAPNDTQVIAQLGSVLAGVGRNPEALDLFRRALKLKPDDPAILSNTAYLIVETRGSVDEALPLAQKAVRLDPGQAHYADTLGWVYFKKGMNDSALQVFGGLTEKYPESATFHYHFGMALDRRGDHAGAKNEFRAVLANKPADDVRQGAEAALKGNNGGGY